MHGHAQPVCGFFALHGVDALGDGAHVVAVAHRRKRPKKQSQGQRGVLARSVTSCRCFLWAVEPYSIPGKLPQHPVFHKFQVAAVQSGNADSG